MTRTALVTGVGGQDGILLARRLVAEGLTVVGTVRPGPREARTVYLDGVDLVELDLAEPSGLGELVESLRPAEVYHLGGLSSVARSWAEPDLTQRVNVDAVEVLLAAVRRHVPQARTFVAASAEIFGPAAPTPQREDTPMDPRSPYATSKAAVRELAVEARRSGSFVSAGILFSHESVLRGEQFVTRKITSAVARIASGRPERIALGNVDAVRDWGAAEDTVRGIVSMLRAADPDDFVLATGRTHAVRDVVDSAFAAAGIEDPWSHIDLDRALLRPADAASLRGDAHHARAVLGWAPKVEFSAVVGSMVRADLHRLACGQSDPPDLLDGVERAS